MTKNIQPDDVSQLNFPQSHKRPSLSEKVKFAPEAPKDSFQQYNRMDGSC